MNLVYKRRVWRREETPIEERLDLTNEDLIKPEDMVVTISRLGYAKTQP